MDFQPKAFGALAEGENFGFRERVHDDSVDGRLKGVQMVCMAVSKSMLAIVIGGVSFASSRKADARAWNFFRILAGKDFGQGIVRGHG